MAKRKRLSSANPSYLDRPARPEPVPEGGKRVMRAPIADVAAETSAQAALDEVADTLGRARDEGRMVVSLPLDAMRLDHLVRDRVMAEDSEMQALMASLKSRGQQTPIEAVALSDGGYGLISGWRRCVALQRLHDETGEARFAEVQALLRRPAEASEAYLAMVEENEIRVGLSYFERARIVAKSVEQGVFADTRAALSALFAAASAAKRSKIGSFLPIVAALDGSLRFPSSLPERLGLSLSRALDMRSGLDKRLAAALAQAQAESAESERAVIEEVLAAPDPAPARKSLVARAAAGGRADPAPASPTAPAPAPEKPRSVTLSWNAARTELRLTGPGVTPALEARLARWLASDGG